MGKFYALKSYLNFGKHKGRRVEEVLGVNPDYLQWCLDNIEWFSLDNEANQELLDTLDEYREYDDETWHPGHPSNHGDR